MHSSVIIRAMALSRVGTAVRRSARLTRCCSRSSTKGDTNLETSPPRLAISRTNVPETNWYWSLGVMNTVSTSGMSWRFMPAIWNSYSKSLTARRPRTTTLPPCSTTKSRSRPRNAITSMFGYLDDSSVAMSSRSAIENIVRL